MSKADFLKAIKEEKAFLDSLAAVVESLDSEINSLHPDYQKRFYQTEIDYFQQHRPLNEIRALKLLRINDLKAEQRDAEQGIRGWPSEIGV